MRLANSLFCFGVGEREFHYTENTAPFELQTDKIAALKLYWHASFTQEV
jgi:hypothetical protein